MSYTDVIKDIEDLAHYREYTCRQCSHKQRVYALVVQSRCERCGVRVKFRRFAASLEVEDVIVAVLAWLGKGEEFKLAMETKRIIDSSPDWYSR